MEHFDHLKFYGVDWIAMTFQLLALYALGLRSRTGFLFGIVGCFFWGMFGLMTGSVADMTANAVCLAMNIIGYIRWSQPFPQPMLA